MSTETNNAILSARQPLLTVPCGFSRAQVTFNGTVVESTLSSGSISFRVAAGGTYTITRLPEPDPTPILPPPVIRPTPEPEPEPEPIVYPDVPESAWYHEAVARVTELGLMQGTGEGFAPELDTTRSMIWMMLARLDGADTEGDSAEDSRWYTAAQSWAVANQVSDGAGPDGAVTREQLVTMLYRYAVSRGLTQGEPAGDLSAFSDSGSVSGFARAAMEWAVSAGIILGADGQLAPQGPATRAQVAAVFVRFVELF